MLQLEQFWANAFLTTSTLLKVSWFGPFLSTSLISVLVFRLSRTIEQQPRSQL